jgi:DNA-directed RNA polymerase
MEALIETRTIERFDRKQDRVAEAFGYGDTVGAMGIAKRFLSPLTKAIEDEMAKVAKVDGRDFKYKGLLQTLRSLPSEVLALCALQNTLHAIAQGHNYRDTIISIGSAIHAECWGANLLRHDPKNAEKIVSGVKRKHGRLAMRHQAARSMAKHLGFQQTRWSKEDTCYAGNWLLRGILYALPEVFVLSEDNFPTITEGGLEVAREAVDIAISNNPMFFPMQRPPEPWTSWSRGGYPEVKSTRNVLVRTRVKESIAQVKEAIASGQMKPTLDALNAIQSVAYRINEPVLAIMQQCYERDVPVKGLPRKADLPKPDKPDWETLTENEQRAWKIKASSVRTRNRGFIGERILFAEDTTTAKLLAGGPFWTPCNLDWRGRVYPLSHFNFQRDDRVRALFLFDQGARIGEEGLRWLKVHLANCGDFGKISKRPMAERVQWVDAHLEEILAMVSFPMGSAHQWWRDADKPFLFLAACMELQQALETGLSFVTRLPCSFDGTCSGLQHLCAMTRAEEGRLVNLTDGELPQDVYETVAAKVRSRIEADKDNPLAAICLAYGIDRKLVKRNVMTYSYSSKKFGMSQQHMEDLMRPLDFKVLDGELKAHPFAFDGDVRAGSSAAKYLAMHVYEAIEEVVTKPAQAMAFLQKCARALAHEGKPLEWTTPTGLPWSNRYHVAQIKKITLWMHDVSIQVNLAVGDQKEIDKDKSANSVAPNFVHACDAAHLMLTVNAANAEGIAQIATVHDSFGCLAPYATRFNAIIREQFAAMYEQNDVLAQALERATSALSVHNRERLPELVEHGSLNINEVINARYAFA